MAVTNAISSVMVGALVAVAVPVMALNLTSKGLGFVPWRWPAEYLGGFLVTARMLAMYKKKDKK